MANTIEIKLLLKRARSAAVSPTEREEQRRSFAYGNARIENKHVTRRMIDEEADKLGPGRGQKKGRGAA